MNIPLRAPLVGSLIFASVAVAYVLPPAAVLRRMADAREEAALPNLKVSGSLTFMGKAAQEVASSLGGATGSGEISVDAVVWLKGSERCRLEISSGNGHWEGRLPAAAQVGLQEICAFLAVRPGATEAKRALVHHLQELGVSLKTSSLSRADRQKVSYLLGEPRLDRGQLYVLKDSFQPARVRFRAREAGAFWDVHFLDYGSAATGDAFPRVVEVFAGPELALRFTALRADTKSRFPDKSF